MTLKIVKSHKLFLLYAVIFISLILLVLFKTNVILSNNNDSIDNIDNNLKHIASKTPPISKSSRTDPPNMIYRETINPSVSNSTCWTVTLPNGRPAIGSKIYLIEISDEIRDDFFSHEDHKNYPFNIKTIFSDSNGNFFFNNLSDCLYLLHAELEGYASAHCGIDAANIPNKINLKLRNSKSVYGEILDVNRKPINNVKVELSLPYLPYSNLFSMPLSDAIDLVYFHAVQYTDINGLFNIDDLPLSELYLTIDENEYYDFCSVLKIIDSHDFTKHTIILKRKCTIEGFVKNYNNKPIENVVIWDISYEYGLASYGQQNTTTDNNGYFYISNAREGNVFLHLTHPDYGSVGQFIDVKIGINNRIDFKLIDGVTKHVWILDDLDIPISGIDVIARDTSNGTTLFQGITNNNGLCKINSLTLGHTITIGVNTQFINNNLIDSYNTFVINDTSDITIKLSHFNKLTLNVYDKSNNKFIEYFNVCVIASNNINDENCILTRPQFTNFYNGIAIINIINNVPAAVHIVAEGYKPYNSNVILSENNYTKTVFLERGVTCSGTIIDKYNNNPIPNARVSYELLSSKNNNLLALTSNTHTSYTDSDGHFILDNLPERFKIRIQADNYSTQSINSYHLLLSTDPSSNSILLTPSSSLTGSITFENGLPVESCRIDLFKMNGEFVNGTFTSPDGKYTINNLPSISLIVRAFDFTHSSLYNWISNYQKEIQLVPGVTKELDFTFNGNSAIKGQCTVNGKPAQGILVKATNKSNNDPTITAYTEDEGLYQLFPLPPGDYTLSICSSIDGMGFYFDKDICVDNSDELSVDFTVDSNSFNGTVFDNYNKPIYGSTVSLINNSNSNIISTHTDIYGNFSYFNLLPGNYDINVSADRYSSLTESIVITNKTVEKNFILNAESLVILQIKDKNGKILNKAIASVIQPASLKIEPESINNGFITFTNLPETRMTFIVGGLPYAPTEISLVTISGDIIKDDITLFSGGYLNLNVRNEYDQPIAGASVSIYPSGLFGLTWLFLHKLNVIKILPSDFTTSPEGTFSIGPLPDGVYNLSVTNNNIEWTGKAIIENGGSLKLKVSL